jgi:hypothetical protein
VGYGGERDDSGVYIASVGSPSGGRINVVRTRAALGTSRQVARVRTVLLTVRLVVVTSVHTIGLPFKSELQESIVRTTYPSGRQ